MAGTSDVDRQVGEQLVRLVQVVFALVVTQSLVLYRDVVVNPVSSRHLVATLALLDVYVMTVWSWVDWHITTTLYPYNLNFYGQRRAWEVGKLVVDLLIVTVYAFVLFSIEPVRIVPSGNLRPYLIGYALIYALYLVAGWIRSKAAGETASNYRPIVAGLAAFTVLALAYRELPALPGTHVGAALGNGLVGVVVLLLTVSYRQYRLFVSRQRTKNRKDQGLRVGIDVDGVLADQIAGILPRLKQRLGVALTREQVTHWALPLGNTDIAKEIVAAMEGDTDYVRTMNVHKGAGELLRSIHSAACGRNQSEVPGYHGVGRGLRPQTALE